MEIEKRVIDYSNKHNISVKESIEHFKDVDIKLQLIKNGSKFGEWANEPFDLNAYFPYKLIEILDEEQGIIRVQEPLCVGKPIRIECVAGLYVEK